MDQIEIMMALNFFINALLLTWGVLLRIDGLSQNHAQKLYSNWKKRVKEHGSLELNETG